MGVHFEWVIAEGAGRGTSVQFEYFCPTSIMSIKEKFSPSKEEK